jgi:hypothetical protein
MQRKTWSDLDDRQKMAVLVAGSVQISLLLTALLDIYRRPAQEIRGSKRMWAAVSLVNFVGPISYFAFGRRK